MGRGTFGGGHAAGVETHEDCPRCGLAAVQTWQVRQLDRPVAGVRVQRVTSSRCPRGCLDDANPWILTEALPTRPLFSTPPLRTGPHPDRPLRGQHLALVEDDEDRSRWSTGGGEHPPVPDAG